MTNTGRVPSEELFVQFIERYVVYCRDERRQSPHTVRAYAADLAALGAFLEQRGVSKVSAVTAEHLRAWVVALVDGGAARTSVARRVSSVRSLWRWALTTGRVEVDPTCRLVVPKRRAVLPKVPSQPAVARALSVAASEGGDELAPLALRDAAIVELLYATGVRVGELVGLNVADVDLARGMVRVTGKGNKERLVPFGSPAQKAVVHYLRQSREGLVKNPLELALFIGLRGRRIDPRIVRKVVGKVLKGHGDGQQLAPHSLRHAAATHMLDGGADLRAVQEQLGHASLASTQIYTHVSIERLKETFRQGHPRA